MTTSHEIRLARRPQGQVGPDEFDLAEVELPAPGPGEVQVRNTFLTVDPYMRGRMNDAKSYVPPFVVGEAMTGGAVGRVVASRSEQVPEGALVVSFLGWREGFTAPAGHVEVVPEPPAGVPASAYLGALGTTGMSAWVGLSLVAPVQEGDVVFVSAAAGAVGTVAGQLAREWGASRVIGSAGGAEKVAALTGFGYDAGFSHRDGSPGSHLSELAPAGIDVYFDNVGGRQLSAAIIAMKDRGRIALCGSISSGYDGTAGDPVTSMGLAVGKRLTLRGFIVSDHLAERDAFREQVGGMLADARIVVRETVTQGLASAPQAFMDLFAGGEQIGKVIIKV